MITDRMVEAAFEKLKVWLLEGRGGRERIRSVLAAADKAAWVRTDCIPLEWRDGRSLFLHLVHENFVVGSWFSAKGAQGWWVFAAMEARPLSVRPLPAPPVQS